MVELMPLTAHLDRTFSALAHPTRRAILQTLSRGDARVTEVAAPFDSSLNAISKHILVLERANLITRRQEGRDHFLSLNPDTFDETLRWMNARALQWKKALKTLDDLLEAENRT